MDGTTIGFISMGVPLGIAMFSLAYKVGKWNGKVSASISGLGDKLDHVGERLDGFEEKCEERMSRVHKRINSIK